MTRRIAARSRFPATLTISLAVLVIFAVPGLSAGLQYDRAAIAAGQSWRLLTGHLTHWNADHLFWDLLMFLVLGALVERRKSLRFVTLCLGSAAAISLALWWSQPDLQSYRGLSGVDTALFTYAACGMLFGASRERRWADCLVPGLLLTGLAAKLAYESCAGETLFVDCQGADFVVVIAAHLTGAAIGSAWALQESSRAERSTASCFSRRSMCRFKSPLKPSRVLL